MIKLITGQPGHGKTLYAISLALAAAKKGRVVYALRIKDLDYEKTGFKPLEKMADWRDLPDGSLILIDECYEDIPARANTKAPPDWIAEFARHRHRGFDFLLVCQLGSQIDPFVRGLVDSHVHVRRKFGFQKALLLTWDRYCTSVASTTSVKEAQRSGWSYPKNIFSLYTSATMHTVQRTVPWQFAAVPLLALLVVACVYFVFQRIKHRGGGDAVAAVATPAAAPTAADPKAPGKPGSAQPPAPEPPKPKSAEEYVAQTLPRVPGMPWSSPQFDDRKPRAQPELYCIDVEGGKCSCYTEQMTGYHMDESVSRVIAREGVYNPYKEPLPRDRSQDRVADPTPRPEVNDPETRRVVSNALGVPQSAVPGGHSRMSVQDADLHQPYDPSVMWPRKVTVK